MGLRDKAVEVGVGWAVGPLFQKLGDGKFGAKPAAIYWALKGKKLLIGAGALFIGGAIALFEPDAYKAAAPVFGIIGTVLAGAGIVDKRLHWNAGDVPAWFTEALHALLGYASIVVMLAGAITHVLKPWPVWSERFEVLCAAVVLAINYTSAKFTEAPVAPAAQ